MSAVSLSAPTRSSPPRAGRREWFGLAVLFLPTLLVAVDNTVLSFALPAISAALAPGATELLWIVDVYPLALAGLLVTMGTLGDRIGRRRLLLIGVAGFGAVSAAAAFATGAAHLVAARALLGVFGAMLMPSTLALLRTLFVDRTQRRLALAIWATGFAAGAALGPVLGGVLLEHAWWGSVFLVNVPVMVALLVLAPLLLQESRAAAAGRLDLLGLVLSMMTMIAFVLGVKAFGSSDVPLALALLVVAAVAGWAFVARARARLRAGREPLLDVELFAAPLFRVAALANATTMFAYTGLLFLLTQYLQLVAGLSPLHAGLLLVPGSIVTMVAGVGAARLARYAPFRVLVPVGLLLAASGYVVVLLLDGVGAAVAASVLIGAGIGLSETLTNDAILASAPPQRAGSASAVSETAYEVGAVLGTAVLGSVLGAAYARTLDVPTSIGPVFAVEARKTLSGAVALGDRVGGLEGQRLVDAATAAFVHGSAVASVVAAVALVGVAATVVVGLRRR
ncbi:MFS transporter [Pseudonocardia charpentierae]|uniref:MFS transporter n=1 Tax=Pseudonocardia charpentierae TaxID=3075545 RepID=A0ABU2N2V8_9PSEU|nr:MFS transporter [Pseudonocardia sp. DSM 45834]MDT0348251.1 MFS transporter [Pseudonocardia sp. DSM 45834]